VKVQTHVVVSTYCWNALRFLMFSRLSPWPWNTVSAIPCHNARHCPALARSEVWRSQLWAQSHSAEYAVYPQITLWTSLCGYSV